MCECAGREDLPEKRTFDKNKDLEEAGRERAVHIAEGREFQTKKQQAQTSPERGERGRAGACRERSHRLL